MSTLKGSISEINALTGLRGIAAIYVVCLHYLGPAPGHAFANPLACFLSHGYLAVDAFFVLSGFVMSLNYSHMFASGWSRSAYLKFLGRRIARIYPLYFAATVAGFLLVLAGWSQFTATIPLGFALLLNLALIQVWGLVKSIDGPAWSISAEWAAYLAFPALLVPTMFRKPWLGWVSALTSAAILAGLCALPLSFHRGFLTGGSMLGFFDPWLAFPLLRCLPEFVFGILAYRVAGTRFGRAMGISRWVAPAICLVIAGLLATPGTDLAIVLACPLLVVSLASAANIPVRILSSSAVQLLGKLSYSIYLTHVFLADVLGWIRGLVHSAGLAHEQSYAACVAVVLTFGVSYIAYTRIELPGRRWLRKLFEGLDRNQATALTVVIGSPHVETSR